MRPERRPIELIGLAKASPFTVLLSGYNSRMKVAAFIRAVNVGGRNIVRMAELRERLIASGLGPVETYLQSGNALFADCRSGSEIEEAMEAILQTHFGLNLSVIARSEEELAATCVRSPFAPSSTVSQEYVTFLRPNLDATKLTAGRYASVEVVQVFPDVVFSRALKEEQQSKGPNPLDERKLGVTTTTRNWKVVRAVRDRLASL